jgi:DNA-binding transcriptional LysR family regulator
MPGMRATFRQLQLFVAFAESGSVTAASRSCHVTQPTVSMQLKSLADAIGLPLNERVGGRFRLTPAGEALLATSRRMSDAWAAFEQDVAGLKGLTRGRLRISVVSTAEYFVPRLLGDFCRTRPGIDVALQVQNRQGVLERLRDDLDDLYIMSIPPEGAEFQRRIFMRNPLVVIAPSGHRLATKGRVSLAMLQGEGFILREAGSGTRLSCAAHFAAIGFSPSVRLELGSNEAIKQAVAAGLGLAVLSRYAVENGSTDERLRILQVQGFPVQANWYVLHSAARPLAPVAAEFLAECEAAVARPQPRKRAARRPTSRP